MQHFLFLEVLEEGQCEFLVDGLVLKVRPRVRSVDGDLIHVRLQQSLFPIVVDGDGFLEGDSSGDLCEKFRGRSSNDLVRVSDYNIN